MSREARRKTPLPSAIFDYWFRKGLPIAKDNEYALLEERTCFACGIFYPLHRCHIIPLCMGGENTVENIHLLCASCHSRSEGNKKYWNWLTYMRAHEWKYRWEWAMKIVEMNGTDVNAFYDSIKDLPFESRMTKIRELLEENDMRISPMNDAIKNG